MNDFIQNLSSSSYLLIAGGYLLGGIPFGLLIGKAHGVDIRERGSGNIGATNLGRALGKRWAFAAFLLDFAKGLVPVIVAGQLLDEASEREVVQILAGAASILGHTFSIYLGFKGGKGVATTFGVIAAVAFPAAVLAGMVWSIVYLATRTVSISSLATGTALPLGIWLTDLLYPFPSLAPRLVFSIAIACLIFIRHRENISRLLRGEELTFRKKTEEEPVGNETGKEETRGA
ncbi:MAG: glycerol-3-phosphate 1-O-acyltransferase PlsY [Planctomycetota bacterium]|nr:glycerol-3-phosphate 1-O-acyltransferase PlsY [Planctomycetota bacterium]